MDNKFNQVRRLVEEDDELKTSDRYTKVRAKNHLFEWSGQQLDILLRRVAGAKKVLTNLLSKKADLVDGKVPKSQLPSDIGVDAVLFSQQTLTPQQQEQAQTNIGVMDLVDFAGVGTKRTESFEVWKNAFRGTAGSVTDNSNYRISQPVHVKFGDIIEFEMTGGVGTSVLSEVLNDDNHTFVRSIATGGDSLYRYIADKDMYVEFSGASANFAKTYSIQSANIANNLPAYKTPDGGYMRALYESAGAVYNEKTGFYELYASEGGLTDITEDEMKIIYAAYNGENERDYFRKFESNSKIRTCFKAGTNNAQVTMNSCWSRCTNIEIAAFKSSMQVTSNGLGGIFYNCQKLRKAIGVLMVNQQSSFNQETFKNCYELQEVLFMDIRCDMSLADSPKVNYKMMKYWVDNSGKASKQLTWTVHPTTYGYLTGTIQPTEQVGGTTEEWQVLVTAAQEKQISFVSA